MAFSNWWQRVNQWTSQQSLEALGRAYQAAIAIQEIEQTHFQGKKIAPGPAVGLSTYNYFKISLDRELRTVRLNLLTFQGGKAWLANLTQPTELSQIDSKILTRLEEIEAIVGKYRPSSEEDSLLTLNALARSSEETEIVATPPLQGREDSRGQGIWRLNRPLDPNSEAEILQQFRQLRHQRKIALRFLAALVIVPLLVQIISKNLIYGPLFNHFRIQSVELGKVEFNPEIIHESLDEFVRFKEGIEIYELLKGGASEINKQEKLREKAEEIVLGAVKKSREGIKNIFADITSLLSFTLLIAVFRRQFTITRQFISHYFLGLNDVTKVFIFILLTDTFVGFHSAEGWEIVLASLMQHIGLPENRNFIFLFIATVPVILDSTFKLLIFNYFTRQSPSAVAILEKMQK